MFRKHNTEEAVMKIMQMPNGDLNRKRMINMLRKEGNLKVLDEDKIRPVQRDNQRTSQSDGQSQEFMPCTYCKGIYRLSSLQKHCRKCPFNEHTDKCNVASMGQNILIMRGWKKKFLDKLRLKTEVFPKMHADKASWIGKNDPVICQYAEDYLRKHKRPHITTAVSNKIRELG